MLGNAGHFTAPGKLFQLISRVSGELKQSLKLSIRAFALRREVSGHEKTEWLA